MAKDAYEQFLAEVLQGVPDDQKAAIEGTLKNEQLAPKIRERVLARSDYSRNMDSLKAEKERFSAEVAEARTKIAGWQNWYGQTSQEFETVRRQNEAYKSQFGELDGDGERRPVGITQEQIDQRLRQEFDKRDASAIAFADVLTEIKLEHRDNFKEKLDTNALVKYATERGLPLDTAYREFVAPRMEERREAEVAERIAAAKAEGRKEALSEHKLPTIASYGDVHILDRAPKVGKTQSDRVAAATAHWNEQGNHSLF